MPFTNDPDYLNSPDDCRVRHCHVCGCPIEDESTATVDAYMARYFCADCTAEEQAENVPQDWTDRPLQRVAWTPRVLNFKF